MRWTNRQYVDLMTYNHPERPMFSELFGPIIGLPEEWRAQGATEDMIEMHAFSFDYVPTHFLGKLGPIHCPDPIVIRDDADYYEGIDHLGRHVRMDKRTATLPLPMTFPVETMEDWLKIKHMYQYDPSRLTEDMIKEAKYLQDRGHLILTAIPGGFDTLRELMGEVNCCIAYYEDPELIHDILDTLAETNRQVLQELCRHITIDALTVHEDMAGKSGPMIGPNLVRQFMVPYYRAAWDIVSDAGTKLFSQDSDGDITPDIDAFMEGGLNVIQPCEPAAGMDIIALRKKYGHKLAFHGGIDKHVLRESKEAIRAEVDAKMQDFMMEGGIVFGLDHRITNGTPLENYIYYVDYARKKMGLPDFRTQENSWSRMAY